MQLTRWGVRGNRSDKFIIRELGDEDLLVKADKVDSWLMAHRHRSVMCDQPLEPAAALGGCGGQRGVCVCPQVCCTTRRAGSHQMPYHLTDCRPTS